jgi:SPP1 gp7 family putative phage head morphogenesis protein
MNLDDWRPVRRNTANYLRDLEAFVQEFIPWRIVTLGGVPSVETEIPAELLEEISRVSDLIARRMVSGVAVTNARSWHAAARQSLHSGVIYEGLKTEIATSVGTRVDELIARNARLIRSIPEEVRARAATFVAREQLRGTRASAIAQALVDQVPQVAQRRAAMIARTEVGKTETALTRARAERLGLDWYEWATSEDQRVRLSHRVFDKVLVAWADAPAPEQLAHEPSKLGHYHPGGAPNCRCLALPLISLDEVRWPKRVYSHGRIEFVNRGQFETWIRLPHVA